MNLLGIQIHRPSQISLITTSIIGISAYILLKYIQGKYFGQLTDFSIYVLTFACTVGSFCEGIGISVKDSPFKSILVLALAGIPCILLAYALTN